MIYWYFKNPFRNLNLEEEQEFDTWKSNVPRTFLFLPFINKILSLFSSFSFALRLLLKLSETPSIIAETTKAFENDFSIKSFPNYIEYHITEAFFNLTGLNHRMQRGQSTS